MNLKVITETTKEPILLDDVKQFLRIDYDEDDFILQTMVSAAREYAETFTRRSIANKTYELTINSYVDRISLANPPFVNIDTVIDSNGETIDHKVIEEYERAIIAFNSFYETAKVTYQAGYDVVPNTIKQAMLILISHFYENRETVIVGTSVVKMPFSVESLLYPHKVGWF